MKQYQDLLSKILTTGVDKSDRTLTGTRSIFGHQMRFDLAEGFPLVTTKKVHLKSIIGELLWMLSGSTNIGPLNRQGIKIWNEWATPGCNLGPIYGYQWRMWGRGYWADKPAGEPIDQISQVIETLKSAPGSRRMLVSAWNVADLPDMALAPCHCLFQFYTQPLTIDQRIATLPDEEVQADGYLQEQGAFLGDDPIHEVNLQNHLDTLGAPRHKLSCQLYQRSADVFLGLPFNIASYALLTMMVAQVCNMVPADFIWTGGDTHLYSNHFAQAEEQLSREPRPLPTMTLNPAVTDIFGFTYDDFTLTGYDPHPAIKAAVSV